MLAHRKDKGDQLILFTVLKLNEYGVGLEDFEDKVILDIGGHIGAFSWLALHHKARKVICFEPDKENFDLLCRNIEEFDKNRKECHNKAVWRSDVPDGAKLDFSGYLDNSGGGNVFFGRDRLYDLSTSTKVDSVSLDTALESVGKVDILKIDCEFAEFPILLTSKRLGQVKNIIGEYHEVGGEFDEYKLPSFAKVDGYEKFEEKELSKFLTSLGFSFSANRNSFYKHLGIFKAKSCLRPHILRL